VAYGMHPVFMVVGTFIFRVQRLGAGRNVCANGCLSSASDNFDKELMMDHDLDTLPKFLRQVITSSPEFLKKSSTYNNLVAMAATVVCNYNQTHGFSRHG
jgi:hypothetical protein